MSSILRRFRFTEFQLLVAPALMTVVGLLTIFLARTGSSRWTWSDIWVSLGYVALIFLMTLWFSATGFKGDQVLFPIVATIAGVGLLEIERLNPVLKAQNEGLANVAQRQVIYLAVGLFLLWAMMVFVKRLDWLRRYKYSWGFFGLAMMAATMVFGTDINGARLWIDLKVATVQPSELVKVLLVVFLAAYLDDYGDLIAGSYRVWRFNLPPIPYLLPMVFMWLAALAIVVLQNDLGTALLFFGIFLVMIYVATARLWYVVAGLSSFAVGVYVAYQMFDRIAIRVQNWINPWADPLNKGFQQIQAEYTMAAGHIFGTGLGYGHPQYIPAVETDYIFAALAEELGLLGTIAILALYVLLVARGSLIALRADRGFPQLLAVGLTTILALQTLIILAGTLRLIPLTGITLPFISAGGSSLLTNFIIVGLLLRISDGSVKT
jgi:cell division protein FtsW (lipid II flippase)